MSGSWRIFKAVAAKKAGQVKGFFKRKKQQTPVDRELPLGLHLNGKVRLDQTPFLVWGKHMIMEFPGKEQVVEGYGVFHIGDAVVHRFYLQSADKEVESMLQIVSSPSGDIEECRLFRSLDEVYPATKEEWDFWLSEEDGYIGLEVFELKDGTDFDRAWDDSDEEHIEPFALEETIYIDTYGENVMTVSHQAMLYGRWVEESEEMAEYVLVSAEEHEDGAFVHIMIGIDMNPMSVQSIY